MAPPRKHETDTILDATRALVLADGPRAASVSAIAAASGAPAGTLYHRFGNRDGILAAAWLRALRRFQERVMDASADTALETAAQMGVAAVRFARDLPDDARLLLSLRPGDLLDGAPGAQFQQTLDAMNAPLIERVGAVTEQLYGTRGARCRDTVSRAVVDLPYAAVRRHLGDIPDWLETDLAQSIRVLLSLTPGSADSPAS